MMHLLLGSWISLGLLVQAAPDEKRVRELLEKLDSDEVSVRQQAQEELCALGEPVLPMLEKARAGASAEARERIEGVIHELSLAPKWAKELLDDATGHEAYGRLEQALRAKTLDKKQVSRIVGLALQNDRASDGLRQNLFSAIERHRLTELWPVLLQQAAREDVENNYALGYLQRLRPPPEAADEMLKVVPRMKNRSAAFQLLTTAASLKPDKARLDGAIRTLLLEGDSDEASRSNLLSALSNGRLTASLQTLVAYWRSTRVGPRNSYQSYVREAMLRAAPDEAVKDVLSWLDSSEPEDVLIAADYVSRHKLVQGTASLIDALFRHASEDRPKELPSTFGGGPAVPRYFGASDQQLRPRLGQILRTMGVEGRIREWLGGATGGPGRAALALAAGELELKGLVSEVSVLAGDKDPAVRREATRALGVLKLSSELGTLEARLKDENLSVRRAALHAIVRIRGAAATPLVLEQLQGDHPDLRAAALEVLPYMESDAVIETLTQEGHLAKGSLRYALAVFLVHQGDAVLHRVMARVADRMSSEDLQSMTRLVQAARGWR